MRYVLAGLLCLVPGVLTAQNPVTITTGATLGPGDRRVAPDLSIESTNGAIGVRIGATLTPPDMGRISQRADLDLVFHPGTLWAPLKDTRLFTGVGLSHQDPNLAPTPGVSAGLIYRKPVWGPMSATLEARYRIDDVFDARRQGLGLRAGLTVDLFRQGDKAAPKEVTTIKPTARVVGSAGRILTVADEYLGIPYLWGGTDPEKGLDCSGFVQLVYGRNGIQLPRVSRDQANAGAELPTTVDALRPGDLMFFASDGKRVDHVAIYAGAQKIVHASGSGKQVRYDDLTTLRGRWYVEHFVGARRVLQ